MNNAEIMELESKLREATANEPRVERISVYATGIICCSVCSPFDTLTTESKLNAEFPTGINSMWEHSSEGFADGSKNPSPCNEKPATHKHYLFTC